MARVALGVRLTFERPWVRIGATRSHVGKGKARRRADGEAAASRGGRGRGAWRGRRSTIAIGAAECHVWRRVRLFSERATERKRQTAERDRRARGGSRLDTSVVGRRPRARFRLGRAGAPTVGGGGRQSAAAHGWGVCVPQCGRDGF